MHFFELRRVEAEIRQIIDAIKSGIRSASMAAEVERLEARKAALEEDVARAPAMPLRLRPGLAEVYRRKVADLKTALDETGSRDEAAGLLRGLVEAVRLVPLDGVTCSPEGPSVDMRVRHQETDDEEEPVHRGADRRRAA